MYLQNASNAGIIIPYIMHPGIINYLSPNFITLEKFLFCGFYFYLLFNSSWLSSRHCLCILIYWLTDRFEYCICNMHVYPTEHKYTRFLLPDMSYQSATFNTYMTDVYSYVHTHAYK